MAKKISNRTHNASGLKMSGKKNRPPAGCFDAQEIQDEIFRKMPADRKIKLASELTMFCLKLNHLNGNYKSGKTSS
ncbi:hypothetical protein A3J02_01030 [Candidatus Azambacteria bacterium RIFCSPLOWO2_02_FULL_46_11]|uniref:Uncharacterized protein n=2 Tax=Candidatus Azamiibacteriota TaxID=1752741 RepID=A0A1F5BHF2_9BACT|nr:MAG: hypothetical protein A2W60_02630 [Candidatus Azambacteria bacterium RIFCSPHIGHO2_02_46_12]OGD44179.1 MAG: hypothetical protein A3J02_01030 [Candidatus Azambacteria bacterium RIFCSPLOWO2_02_FULL_46_11]